MQKVICNSSILIHLAKIGKIELLKEYFQEVTIPEAVYKECIVEGDSRDEISMIKSADWIRVLKVNDRKMVKLLQSSLDDGESEAIALALETKSELILLDDSDAREKARLFGLTITGTIGILLRAKVDGKIYNLKEMLEKLRETGFRITDTLQTKLLKEAGEA